MRQHLLVGASIYYNVTGRFIMVRLNDTYCKYYDMGDGLMPDISMCQGRNCPQKETCYRYKATPNEYWQSWAEFDTAREEDGLPCQYYWKWYKGED